MSDHSDRPNETWLLQLGAVMAALPETNPDTAEYYDTAEVGGETEDDRIAPAMAAAAALPAWPWAISGLGLCLAVLALGPLADERGPQPADRATAPQVHGWRSPDPGASAAWPPSLPAIGFQGLEPPPAPKEVPPPLPLAIAPASAPVDVTVPPLALDDRVGEMVQAMVAALAPPAPPEPPREPIAEPVAPARSELPPPVQPVDLPAAPAAPAPVPEVKPVPEPPPAARPTVQPRRAPDPPPVRRAAPAARAKPAAPAADSDGPTWRDGLFGRRHG